MANPYEIPFAIPDLGPAVALLQAARNQKRANKRADANLEFQVAAHADNMRRSQERESHERKIAADLLDYNRKKEAWTQRDALFRAAQRSVPAANQNPFGYKFDETRDLPANVEGPEFSPAAEEARFAPKPTAPAAPPIQAEAPIPEPGEPGSPFEGPQAIPMQASGYEGGGIDAFGDQERQRAAENMDAVGTGLQGDRVVKIDEPFVIDNKPEPGIPSPAQPLMMQAAANTMPGPEGKRRVMGSFQGGQMFELPEQATTSGYGPKYDVIYQRFLQEPGITPEEALNAVTKMAHQDAVESGRDTRAERAEDARSQRDAQYKMDIAAQFEQQRRALEQSDKNNRRSAAASMARTGDVGTKQSKMDLGIERETDAIVKEVLNQTSYKGRVTDDQKFNQMSTVIAGAKNNAALAAAGAGMWVKQAQGGTGVISDSDMNQFWGKIGGVQDKVENYVANALSGKMGAGKQKIVAEAIRTLANQSKKNIQDVGKRIEARLYPIGEKVPQVDDRIQTYLDTYVPGAKRTTRARSTPKGTALDEIEAQLDALGGGQ